MVNDWEEFAARTKSLKIGEDFELTIGLGTTFYFEDAGSIRQRTAVKEIFDSYIELVGRDNITWFSLGPENLLLRRTRGLRSWDISPYLLSEKWSEVEAANHAWSLTFHGGDNNVSASDFLFEAYGEAPNVVCVHGGLSFLKASFPVDFFLGRMGLYYEFLRHTIARIAPVYAYASPSLLTSVDLSYVQRAANEIARLAFRYPALDIDFPYLHVLELGGGIKGPAWLIYLGPELAERTRSAELLGGECRRELQVEEVGAGLIIRVGEGPVMVDRNRDERWPAMEALADCLQPLFIRNHGPLLPTGTFSDPDRVLDWIFRFNRKAT